MTKEEALNFLPLEDVDDLKDLFEEKLFEMKQFFIMRFPVTKVIQGRLRKLKNLTDAYEMLGGSFNPFQEVPEVQLISSAVKEVIEEYQSKRSQLKFRMTASYNSYEVMELANALIQLTRLYAAKWSNDNINTEGAVVSAEPNPMELLASLNAFNEKGYVDFTSIGKISEQNVLVREVKRLSLWQKMDSYE